MKIQKIFPLILGVTVMVSGCNALQPAAAPTTDPTAMGQIVAAVQTNVAATAVAQSSVVPTDSPVVNAPTYTPFPTYTPYPTFTVPPVPTVPPVTAVPTLKPTVAWVASLTPTSAPEKWACSVLSVSPASGKEYDKGVDFDGKFTVKNTGTKSWISSDMDIVYVSGEKTMIKHEIYDLKSSVDPGNSIDITLDFTSPSSSGDYKVEYNLRGGSNFCGLIVNIKVK